MQNNELRETNCKSFASLYKGCRGPGGRAPWSHAAACEIPQTAAGGQRKTRQRAKPRCRTVTQKSPQTVHIQLKKAGSGEATLPEGNAKLPPNVHIQLKKTGSGEATLPDGNAKLPPAKVLRTTHFPFPGNSPQKYSLRHGVPPCHLPRGGRRK